MQILDAEMQIDAQKKQKNALSSEQLKSLED